MSDLNRLSLALGKGRRFWTKGLTREKILEALLRQRAEARRQGLQDQERMLRDQILWSLPMQSPEDDQAKPEDPPRARSRLRRTLEG